MRVEQPSVVREAFTEALRTPGPVLVDVATDPNALSILPKINGPLVKGFALVVSRSVLSGGVGKMTQRARSDLRNVPRR